MLRNAYATSVAGACERLMTSRNACVQQPDATQRLVLDINEVQNPYNPNGLPSTKVLVQATGAYSSYRSHQWPTEKDYRGLPVWSGEYPRATWIYAEKVVASPCRVELFPDGTVNGLRQVKDLRCCV